MIKRLLIFFFLISHLNAFANEPQPNLTIYKTNLANYYKSGGYAKDIAKVAEEADHYLNERVTQNKSLAHPKKLAIVFDIDETILSNYAFIQQNDFAYPLDTIHANQPKAADLAIPATFKLYQNAIEDNVAVFFITGRTEPLREATIANLKQAGFTQWTELILKPNNYHEKSAAIFKTAARKRIEQEGYDILISIGDQDSDLSGGYADKTFKLPNPYYYIP